MTQAYLAIDLGAESGRVIAGTLADGRMRLDEIHRFAHEPVWLPTGLHWDVTGIWREIVAGLRKAAAWAGEQNVRLVSIGVDTWGVDWALVDSAGELVGLPHAYRDPRNQAAYEKCDCPTRCRADLPDHRHPVHGNQHALLALRARSSPIRARSQRPIGCSSCRT